MFRFAYRSRQDQAQRLAEEGVCLAIVGGLLIFHFGGAVFLAALGSFARSAVLGYLMLAAGVAYLAWLTWRNPRGVGRVAWAIFVGYALALLFCVAVAGLARAGSAHDGPYCGGSHGGVTSLITQDLKRATVYCADGTHFNRYPNASVVSLNNGDVVILYDDNWSVVVRLGAVDQYDPEDVLRSVTDANGGVAFGVWHAEPHIDQ